MNHTAILNAISIERDRQMTDLGWTLEHDQSHTTGEWQALIYKQMVDIDRLVQDGYDPGKSILITEARIQMAALLVAWMESEDNTKETGDEHV